MTKLITYYSRTKNNATVAKELSKLLKCDIEEIVSKESYKGIFGFVRGGKRGFTKKASAIEETKNDPSKYDLVVLVYPIWGGGIAPPMKEYITSNKFKNIAVVSVSGSGKEQKSVEDLIKTCGKTPVAKLMLSDKEIKAKTYKETLKKFAKSL